jgi:hypothetical protein
MKKWLSILMVLVVVALFSFGCAGVSKEAKVKCPKCGAVFTIQEGLDALERNR